MGKIVKGSPNQKRRISLTLASLQAFNSHIDLIALVYEIVTEQKENYEKFEDDINELDFVDAVDTIKKQFGIEKEIEIYLFINYLKKLYVTDYRGNNKKVASKKSLIYFDDDETIIKQSFNAELIYAELQIFYIQKEKLSKMKERLIDINEQN